jgi:peptidoglycan/LPS O-acetylase OafA/YrhL
MVLLPALLLGGLLDLYSIHQFGKADFYTTVDPGHEDPSPNDSFPTLVGNTLFLQTIKIPFMGGAFVQSFGSNQPLWSLCNEFWYYIAFPPLVLLFAKGRSWPVRAACVLGFVFLGWFVGPRIALQGIPWLMGALITYIPPFPAHRKALSTVAMIVAPLLTVAGIAMLGKYMRLLYCDLTLGVIVTFLLWVTLSCATAPLPSFYVRLSTRLARSSYTLYLTHFPFLIFLKVFFALPLFVDPDWHLFFLRLGFLPVIILYSQLIYELFEKRTDPVRKWLKPYVLGNKKLVPATN